MPLLAPLASLFRLSPLRIIIVGPVHLLLVEWAEFCTTARHLFKNSVGCRVSFGSISNLQNTVIHAE
jgi:hypothetical protein